MPPPLAAQLAIALGCFQHGVIGATAVGLAFVVPSFVMVIAISMAYVRFGGLWGMQALFHGNGAVVIAIIAIVAYRFAVTENVTYEAQRDTLGRHVTLLRRGHSGRLNR